MSTQTRKQGETAYFNYSPSPSEDVSAGWTCNITVTRDLDATPAIDRPVTTFVAGSTGFAASLTTEETAALAPGTYIVIGQLTKTSATPPLNREAHSVLKIVQQGKL